MSRKLKKFLEEEMDTFQLERDVAIMRKDKYAQMERTARLSELKRIKNFLMKEPNRDFDVFCTNCWFELSSDELGLFISEEDNKLAYFCPNCGFWEFCSSDEAPSGEETEEILENGPKRVYEYPKNPIIPIPNGLFLRQHERILKEYQQRREIELKKEMEDFNHLF